MKYAILSYMKIIILFSYLYDPLSFIFCYKEIECKNQYNWWTILLLIMIFIECKIVEASKYFHQQLKLCILLCNK